MPPTGELAHNLGVCPDWESTGDLLVHKPALNPLRRASPGLDIDFNTLKFNTFNNNLKTSQWPFLDTKQPSRAHKANILSFGFEYGSYGWGLVYGWVPG